VTVEDGGYIEYAEPPAEEEIPPEENPEQTEG
jgi:hypothetical protein